MPRKTITVLTDDLDGKELPEDTQPTRFTLGRTTYLLYLSDQNNEKFLDALKPYIDGAETETTARSAGAGASRSSNSDKEKLKKVREWAIASKAEYTNAAGQTKTLGDRGRIPQEVIDAYDKAH